MSKISTYIQVIIKELREEGYQLKYLLKAMELAKSTYYFEISKKNIIYVRNAEITEKIKGIFEHHKRRYGVRRIHMELNNSVYHVNHKRVQRIMHQLGLMVKRPKEKYHSYKGEVEKIAVNLINRDFSTNAPFEKQTTDI